MAGSPWGTGRQFFFNKVKTYVYHMTQQPQSEVFTQRYHKHARTGTLVTISRVIAKLETSAWKRSAVPPRKQKRAAPTHPRTRAHLKHQGKEPNRKPTSSSISGTFQKRQSYRDHGRTRVARGQERGRDFLPSGNTGTLWGDGADVCLNCGGYTTLSICQCTHRTEQHEKDFHCMEV